MKVDVNEAGHLVLSGVYNDTILKTEEGNMLVFVCETIP